MTDEYRPTLKVKFAKLLATTVMPVFVPLMSWCSRVAQEAAPELKGKALSKAQPDPTAPVETPAAPIARTEPHPDINMYTFGAAMQAYYEFPHASPELAQSILNALMDNTESSGFLQNMTRFLGVLIATYSPEEGLKRLIANALLLGMHLDHKQPTILLRPWEEPPSQADELRAAVVRFREAHEEWDERRTMSTDDARGERYREMIETLERHKEAKL